MRNINFADHLEKKVAEALFEAGIDFVYENENKKQKLDFYLPLYDIFIEIKQFHSDRISRQMSEADNVIAIQGIKSVKFLISMLNEK